MRGLAGLVLGLGLTSLAAWVSLACVPDLTRRLPLFFALDAVLFAAYALLVIASRWGERLDRRGRMAVLAFAVLFRAAAVAAPPSLSADLYRYLWDGCVLLSGESPFRHPPAAPELASLQSRFPEVYAGIGYRELPTLYPVTAQLAFAAVAGVWPRAAGMKLAMGALDLATLLMVAAPLKRLRLPPGRILIPAWSPLSILELSGMGHMDAIAVALLTGALLALARRRDGLALAALAGSIHAKFLPLILVPAFLARTRRRAWLVLAMVPALAILPFLGGVDPTVSLRTFVAHWRGNEVIFTGLVSMAGSLPAAKCWAALLTLAAQVACLARRTSPAASALFVLATALLLSPVLHPWYLTWLPPLLALRPSVALFTWTGSVVLAYFAWGEFHAGGVYEVSGWVPAVELALPLAAVAAAAGWSRLRRSSGDRRSRCGQEGGPAFL